MTKLGKVSVETKGIKKAGPQEVVGDPRFTQL
jgi:hypothetical protein